MKGTMVFNLEERTLVFNGMLYDTVNTVLRDYDAKQDRLAADNLRRVLGYIRDKMVNADVVSREVET